MAEYDEKGVAVAAAKILLSLRTRKLTRWPDWIPLPSEELAAPAERPSVEPEVDLPPLPEGWPKGLRSPLRPRETGWSLSLDGLLERMRQPVPARSVASSSEEDERAWSAPRVRVRKAKRESLAPRRSSEVGGQDRASPSGSEDPSTSGVERARRPHLRAKAAARKDPFVAASSPDTPFDYAAAAGSGASSRSSGDEGAARSSAKRKASRSGGGPSSGDEGCSSPAKRTRPDFVYGAAQDTAAVVQVQAEMPEMGEKNRDEKGHLLFDLNEVPEW